MKKGYSFFLFTLFLLSPLISSAGCIDWYLVTIDKKTGEVLHEEYLSTSCDGCGNEMCLEDNDTGGGSDNSRAEIRDYVNPAECSKNTTFFAESRQVTGCAFDIVGKTIWEGYGEWDSKVLKANKTSMECAIWTSTIKTVDTGSKTNAYPSRNEVVATYKADISYEFKVTFWGFINEYSGGVDFVYESRSYSFPDKCFN